MIDMNFLDTLNLTYPIGLPPHTPLAQKIADQRWLITDSENRYFFIQNDVIKGRLVWINIVFYLFNVIRSNKL